MLFMRHYWLETYAGCIFSVDKNCSAKAAALCTEEKARLSIFDFYRRRRKRKSWKKNMFSFSEIGPYRFFPLEVTTKALGTYIRDLRDLQLHRKPLPLPRVEVLHPENLPGSLHHSCICCTSAFLCHFCPFCTCQAAGRTQGYSVWEGVKPHSWEEETVLKSFWMKKTRNWRQF